MTSITTRWSTGKLDRSRNRRVLRVITRLNIGGPSIQAVALTGRLAEFGYDSRLVHGSLSRGEGDMGYLLEREGVTATALPALRRAVRPVPDARAAWQLYRLMCAFRPDIVHTHTAKAGAVGRCAAMAYNRTAGRCAAARVVHTYHGHVFDGYFGRTSTEIFLGLERWLARSTDRLIAVSPRIADEITERYRIGRPDQVRPIRLGLDLAPFAGVDEAARRLARRQLAVPDGAAVVTTVGRLTEIKQHGLFLEMARRVLAVRGDVLFLVAGDGELRVALEARAAALRLGSAVRFLGWRQDLPNIYGASDLFVLTSRNEGTPVALIEAMASGTPGVSTDVGGVRDILGGSNVGRIVPFGDAAALASAVLSLLGWSDTARRAMGLRARDAVIERFAMERLVSDVVKLYDELLNPA